MRLHKCHIFAFLSIILLVPFVINFICLTTTPYVVVGDGKLWLGFFGNYIGGAMPVLMTMWVIRSEKTKEIARKRYENQKSFYDKLCSDMGELCGVLDPDKFSFLIQRLQAIQSPESIDSYVKDLSEMDNKVKSTLNTFILQYGHTTSQEQQSFLSFCYEFSEKMRDEITNIQALSVELQQTENNGDFRSRLKGNIERFGIFLKQEQPIPFAKKWEQVEYTKLNELRENFENC